MNHSIHVMRRPRRVRPSAARAAASIGAVVTLALLAAACSGSGGSRSAAGSTNAGGSTSSPSAVAYSHCMRSHGVPNYPDSSTSGGIPKASAQQLGVSDSQYRAAKNACLHLIPGSGSTAEQQQEAQCAQAGNCSQPVVQRWMSGLLTLAQCLRSHGEPNWPDPSLDSQGIPYFNYSQAGIDHRSPQVWSQVNECVRLTRFEGLPLP
jgi:hypothetical protein